MSFDLLKFYRPSAKDLASGGDTWLRRYFKTLTATAASASIVAADTQVCPPDTVIEIETAIIFWDSGAAQLARSSVVWISDQGSAVINGVVVGANAVGGVTAGAPHRNTYTDLSVFMFPGDLLNFAATWDAGAAANTINVYLSGWMFPRGSLQR